MGCVHVWSNGLGMVLNFRHTDGTSCVIHHLYPSFYFLSDLISAWSFHICLFLSCLLRIPSDFFLSLLFILWVWRLFWSVQSLLFSFSAIACLGFVLISWWWWSSSYDAINMFDRFVISWMTWPEGAKCFTNQ